MSFYRAFVSSIVIFVTSFAFLHTTSATAFSNPKQSKITRVAIKFDGERMLVGMADLGSFFYFFDGDSLWVNSSGNLKEAILSLVSHRLILSSEADRLLSGNSFQKWVGSYANCGEKGDWQKDSQLSIKGTQGFINLLLGCGWSESAIQPIALPPAPPLMSGLTSPPLSPPMAAPVFGEDCCLGDGSLPLIQFCLGYCNEGGGFGIPGIISPGDPVVEPLPGGPGGPGGECNDQDPCTIDYKDAEGQCQHVPKDCSDNNPCTIDYCDPETGVCMHIPIPGCQPSAPGCDDGDPCTIDYLDAQEQCQHVPKNCSDNNPCTYDYCDPDTGNCIHVLIPDCEEPPPPPPPPPPCEPGCSLKLISAFPSPLCSGLDDQQNLQATFKITNTSSGEDCPITPFTVKVSSTGAPNITGAPQYFNFSLGAGQSATAQVTLVKQVNSPGGQENVTFEVIDGGNCSATAVIQVGEAKCNATLSSETICQGESKPLSLTLTNPDPYCTAQYFFAITQSGLPDVSLAYSNPGSEGIFIPPGQTHNIVINATVAPGSSSGTEQIDVLVLAKFGGTQKNCSITSELVVPEKEISGNITANSPLVLVPGASLELPFIFKNVGLCDASFTWRLQRPESEVKITPALTTGGLTLEPGKQSNLLNVMLNVASDSPGGTVPYELSVLQDGAWQVKDTVTIQVIDVDLAIYKPAVLDPTQAEIPDEIEISQGSQTWVNLDNDDKDEHFDNKDNEVSGDDELVKIQLRFKPQDMTGSSATVTIESGTSEGLKIWQKAEKLVSYNPGAPIPAEDLVIVNGMKTKDLWVEGLKPGKYVLKLNYTNPQGTPLKDEVSLTVLGIKTLEWLGMGNGFTENSNSNDSDTLDDDPNFPTNTAINGDLSNPIVHKRVFSDARWPETSVARDKVKLRITIDPQPVFPVSVYLRAFDVDDPSDNTQYIDPNDQGTNGIYFGTGFHTPTGEMSPSLTYTKDEDNRGSVAGLKSGGFSGSGATQATTVIDFPPALSSKETLFQVSHFAGDNYRIAAFGDSKFLTELRNFDKEDGFALVDPTVSGETAAKEIQNPMGFMYESPILTVWRLLHIETHSMAAVPQGPADPAWNTQRNQVEGLIVKISPNVVGGLPPLGTLPSIASLSTNLVNGLPNGIPDNSPNNDTNPQGLGRFEKGKISIGIDQLVQGVDGNGNDNVVNLQGFNLPCSLTAANLPVITGTVYYADFSQNLIVLNSPNINPAYAGGTLKIAGSTFSVTTVLAFQGVPCAVNIQPASGIPFILKDDDDWTRLPHMPEFSMMKNAYAPVYFLPLEYKATTPLDGIIWHPILSFILNLNIVSGDPNGGYQPDIPKNKESDVFWVAYVGNAYQPGLDLDQDPNSHKTALGMTRFTSSSAAPNTVILHGGDSSWIFVETCYDGKPTPAVPLYYAAVLVHEMGHQLGLEHAADTTSIMSAAFYSEAQAAGQIANGFNPLHRHFLRSRPWSPNLKFGPN